MDWDAVTWSDFEQALVRYRDKFYRQKREEQHYLDIYHRLQPLPLRDKAGESAAIVRFLNLWNCRLSTAAATAALPIWMEREAAALEALVGLSVEHAEAFILRDELDRLHASLIELKWGCYAPRVQTMGDAAASKTLHVLIPPLFVMWDRYIRGSLPSYGAYMAKMHTFAVRLRNELAPPAAREDLEGYLQRHLEYPVRKTLAKHIDEYNWYVAFGHTRA
jgi:hypothetical protein